jgi:hypothetical protein
LKLISYAGKKTSVYSSIWACWRRKWHTEAVSPSAVGAAQCTYVRNWFMTFRYCRFKFDHLHTTAVLLTAYICEVFREFAYFNRLQFKSLLSLHLSVARLEQWRSSFSCRWNGYVSPNSQAQKSSLQTIDRGSQWRHALWRVFSEDQYFVIISPVFKKKFKLRAWKGLEFQTNPYKQSIVWSEVLTEVSTMTHGHDHGGNTDVWNAAFTSLQGATTQKTAINSQQSGRLSAQRKEVIYGRLTERRNWLIKRQ